MFQDMKILVKNRNLVVDGKRTSAITRIVFNIEAFRFLSWIMRLVRILLINTSKIY